MHTDLVCQPKADCVDGYHAGECPGVTYCCKGSAAKTSSGGSGSASGMPMRGLPTPSAASSFLGQPRIPYSKSYGKFDQWFRREAEDRRETNNYDVPETDPRTGRASALGYWSRDMRAIPMSKSGMFKINRSHRISLDAIRYTRDSVRWGMSDFWATPMEIFENNESKGDCEDYALLNYVMLKRLGFPVNDMMIMVVRDLQQKLNHAILKVHFEGENYILDNQRFIVIKDSILKGVYKPIIEFNENGTYLYGKPSSSAASNLAMALGESADIEDLVADVAEFPVTEKDREALKSEVRGHVESFLAGISKHGKKVLSNMEAGVEKAKEALNLPSIAKLEEELQKAVEARADFPTELDSDERPELEAKIRSAIQEFGESLEGDESLREKILSRVDELAADADSLVQNIWLGWAGERTSENASVDEDAVNKVEQMAGNLSKVLDSTGKMLSEAGEKLGDKFGKAFDSIKLHSEMIFGGKSEVAADLFKLEKDVKKLEEIENK